MKKTLCALILLIGLLSPALYGALGEEPVTTTVMVYMCGSNLESQYGLASGDILEMMDSGYNSRYTDVVLMIGGSSRWDLGVFDPEKSSICQIRGSGMKELWSGDAMSMGSSDTLSWFLNTVYEEYQSDRYVLILWNHGGGPVKGVCWDENFDEDYLGMPELVAGLENSPFSQRKLDMIGFDACLMGSVESAWMLSGYADYMVASEETEPGKGWNYNFLNGIEADASMADTGIRVVDSYIESFPQDCADGLTLSCIDLSRIDGVLEHMDAYFSELSDLMSESMFSEMSSFRHYAQGFGRDFRVEESTDYDMVDMVSLLDAYEKYGAGSGEALRAALNDAVVYSRSNQGGSHGLSVYFPYFNQGAYANTGIEFYNSVDFCAGYEDYIRRFQMYMTGERETDWRDLVPVVTREGDGFRITLDLTPQQQENMVSARLVVFETKLDRDLFLTDDNSFGRIYSAIADSEGGGLSARYHNELFSLEYEENGEYSSTGAFEFVALETGDYEVQGWLGEDPDVASGEYARLVLSPPDENGIMSVRSIRTLDSMTGTYTPRTGATLEDFSYLHVAGFTRQVEREDGLILPYERWEAGTRDAAGVVHMNYIINTVPLASDWRFIRTQEARGLTYAAFEITDSQNRVFLTELTRIRPDEEIRLFEQFGWSDEPAFFLRYAVVAYRRDMARMYMEFTNMEEERSCIYQVQDVSVNGMPLSGSLVSDGVKDAVASDALGGNEKTCVYVDFPLMDVLDSSLPLPVDDIGRIKTISFRLGVFDAETRERIDGFIGEISPDVDMFELYQTFR